MPPTRGDQKRYIQHLTSPQPPKMSSANVSFGVSEPFRDQSDPSPIPASAAVRECLDLVASCMGERIESNSRFSVAATTLPTGSLGQEAQYTFDPSQRNTSGHTIGNLVTAAAVVERTVWRTEEGQIRHKKAIANARRLQQYIRGENIGIEEGSIEASRETTRRDQKGSRRVNSEQGTDDEEDPGLQQHRDQNR